MHPFFKDDDFQFATENVLGGVFHRAADVGEVLATIDNIPNGKAAAWVEQWSATADRLAGQAAADAEAGRLRSAAARYLRAANYYSEASDKADATPDPALFTALWEKHRNAWDRFVDLSVESGALDVERDRHPVRGHDAAGLLLPVRCRRRTAAHADLQQRQRRIGRRVVGARRRRRPRPRLERHDLRRPRAERRADPAGHPVPAATGRTCSPRSSTPCAGRADVDAARIAVMRREPGRLLGAPRRRVRAPHRRRDRRPGCRRRLDHHARPAPAAAGGSCSTPVTGPSSTGRWDGRSSSRPRRAR